MKAIVYHGAGQKSLDERPARAVRAHWRDCPCWADRSASLLTAQFCLPAQLIAIDQDPNRLGNRPALRRDCLLDARNGDAVAQVMN